MESVAETAAMEAASHELKCFRRSNLLPSNDDQADELQPLQWWKLHQTSFPIIAEVAKIVLSVPGSQIECERVFSLAGLLTTRLRNRLTTANLAMSVFLRQNIDLSQTLKELLGNYYGEQSFSLLQDELLYVSETRALEAHLDEAVVSDNLNWDTIASYIDEVDPLIPEHEYHHHTMGSDGHWQ